jgi:predicted amidohydrolase
MARRFGIAGVQMAPVPWDAEATVAKMAEVISQIKDSFPWVQLLLFPELIIAGEAPFVRPPVPNAWAASAQPIPGPLAARLCEAAQSAGVWLAPGSMYESAGEAIYNTAIVISPAGEIVARYRKMFPWLPFEGGIQAGDQFCTFDVPGAGRFGLCICYDSWFPEVARTLAWLGAEVILRPTLTATSDRALELVLSQANAIFNQCYFIDVNAAGAWGGGRSLIVDPNGRVLQQAGDGPAILTETLDLDLVQHVREFGTLGVCQTWKQLRDYRGEFPVYRDRPAAGPIFRGLGELRLHDQLRG